MPASKPAKVGGRRCSAALSLRRGLHSATLDLCTRLASPTKRADPGSVQAPLCSGG